MNSFILFSSSTVQAIMFGCGIVCILLMYLSWYTKLPYGDKLVALLRKVEKVIPDGSTIMFLLGIDTALKLILKFYDSVISKFKKPGDTEKDTK